MSSLSNQSAPAIATSAGLSYRRLGRRRLALLAAAATVLIASLLVDVMTGPAMLSIGQVIDAISSPSSTNTANTIVWTFRMPTALLAVIIGAALGVAGAQMQTILDNPLASPYTLGVSAAAGFGAALAMVFGAALLPVAGVFLLPASAFAFAMLGSLAVYGIARLKRGSTEGIILGGVALLFLFNAGIALLQYVAGEDELSAIVFWMFGSLQGATWPRVGLMAAVVCFVVPLLAANAWRLTALRLGDQRAASLGIDVQKLRLKALLLASLLTAVAVCFAGAIGFIGLVAPHLARMMVGEDQRYFMPQSALTGAAMLSLASIVSKLAMPGAVLPVGIVTALIGVPFFAAMVLTRKRSHW